MEIARSQVSRLTIRELKGLDPIHVFVENIKSGAGRMTIICSGDAWSYGWQAMGEKTYLVEMFVQKCDVYYLAKKLAPNTSQTETDESKLEKDAKKTIIERRREDSMTKEQARDLYDIADRFNDGVAANHDLLFDVYGDEWWYCLPTSPNPQYEYVCKVIQAVKDAFAMEDRELEKQMEEETGKKCSILGGQVVEEEK